jgi:phosphate transport system substrate-binding protein
MPLLIILIPLATLLLGILRFREKRRFAFRKDPEDSRFLPFIIIQAIINAIDLAFMVFLTWIFVIQWHYRILMILLAILVEVFSIFFMLQIFTKKKVIVLSICGALVIGGIAGSIITDVVREKNTMHDYFDYTTYVPFEKDSPVKQLDEESTLRFTDQDYDSLPAMNGATALYPIYAAFAQATYPESMERMDLWRKIEYVSCSTTTYAYEKIVDGDADIIFVGGPSKEQEEYAAQKGVKLEYVPIGREAFVFFVHPKNPVSDLSLDQIRDIYSGKTTEWKQLGVKGIGKIQAFQREPGSGSQTAMLRFVMRDTPMMTPEKEQVHDGMGGIVDQVSEYRNNRGAIGYSFRFYTTELMRDFNVKLLSVNGVKPTIENIENGKYPLASEFYAVVRSDASENTRKLLEWICGPQGQELIRKTGYTPLNDPAK